MSQNPLHVALWRFEQISIFLDTGLTPGERSRMIDQASRIPVLWLSGEQKPVPRSSLYRWLHLYRQNPVIESLMSKPREKSKRQTAIHNEWVEYALALLEQESARSLFILTQRIKLHFGIESDISASSLHRALSRQPRYIQMKRVRNPGSTRFRTRFIRIQMQALWALLPLYNPITLFQSAIYM